MITLKNNQDGKFIIYHTSTPEVTSGSTFTVVNDLSKKEVELPVLIENKANSFILNYAATTLTEMHNTLIVSNDGEVIYTEKVYVQ